MSHPVSKYLVALALVASPAAMLHAQNAAVSGTAEPYTQEAAPIERNAPPPQQYGPNGYGQRPMQGGPNGYAHAPILTAQPAHGVTVLSDKPVQTIASDAQHVEVKLDHGRANVIVRNPSEDQLVLVDLPGGQTQLLKNGFYTFNADTNTVRVLSGEADAFAGANEKPSRIKGDDQAVFVGGSAKVSDSDLYTSRQDVLPGGMGYATPREDYRGGDYGYAPYGFAGGYGGYDDEPYGYGWGGGYPYYGYGWGYPYYGYGLGFGWGGGWGWGGGYYGGYRGGYYGGRGGVYRGGGPIHAGGYGGGGFHGGSGGGGGGHVSGGGGGHR